MNLSEAFQHQAKQFRTEFDELATTVDHSGEAGSAREIALRELLARHLPRRAGVGSGFVVDAAGGQSRQVDVVLYDQSAASVFEVAGINFFPCETVIGVGQVKAGIQSARTLQQALDNIASVKSLDRSNGGRNRPITGPGYSMSPQFTFDPTKHRDQILGFIFTGRSLREATLLEAMTKWMGAHDRTVWPNIYCDFNSFLISYEDEEHLTTSAMDARNLYGTSEEERSGLLLLFIILVSSFVNEAHVARPGLFGYAGIGSAQHRDVELP